MTTFIPSAAGAGEPSSAASRTPAWTVDDLARTERSDSWSLDETASKAVWVRTTIEAVEGQDQSVSNLWLTDLAAAESFPLTRGRDSVASPAFSPDGRFVAFISDRDLPAVGRGGGDDEGAKPAERQVWLLPLYGGEPFPLTRFDRDVQAFGWQDAATVVVAAQESASAWERERKKAKDATRVVDDEANEPPVRLFLVPVAEKAEAGTPVPKGATKAEAVETEVLGTPDSPRRLTRNADWIDSLRVSPDGRWAAVTAQQSLRFDFDQKVPPRAFLVDLATGEAREILEGREHLPSAVRWAADSSGFYFRNERSTHPFYRLATVTDLYFYDLAGRRPLRVDLDWPRGVGEAYTVLPEGVVALLADGVRDRAALLRRQGDSWQRQNLEGRHAHEMQDVVASRDGKTLVYRHSTATIPIQWYRAELRGGTLTDERRLTRLNPSFDAKPTGRVELRRWEGAGGETVEGLLHYPLDWPEEGSGAAPPEPPAPRPLVVDVHGGPAGRDHDAWDQRWSGPLLLWRQRGAFVLQVNYHGSAGYGLEWVESISDGRYYESEFTDISSGIDALIAEGLVDGERLGCAGWSNGGILCADFITRTPRFRAASVGAADVEWFSDWANVDFGAAFDNYYFGGTPWEKPEVYKELSPFFRLDQVTTPTIVFTGTEDRSVPPHQSWSLFRALQYMGKAPVRLVLFPGEGHGLRKIAHQRRKIEEDLAWFDRYLFGKKDETNPAVPDDSPLAAKLALQRAARDGEVLGEPLDHGDGEQPVLVPETLAFEGLQDPHLEVGRFEVTRAQFAAFEPTLKVLPGQENLPVTGISFEKAQGYVRWLAEVTGRPFRLPTTAEAARLAREAGSGGNTLDRWAGYSPNPEDARRLLEAAEELSGEAPLLRTAGSFRGHGKDPVYDLDGNAAEWAVGEDGQGVAVGPSADRTADRREAGVTDDPRYIGLRVVVEAAARAVLHRE